ncbi:RNA polymerase sigma-70 factor [gamma proteobacterium IMCC2047]|nr:RNA polymerase sigma-70 factor [gamma proteobacterium IMCC2047]
MQEAYIKAFGQLSRLKNANALPGWLSRITRNEALQYRRKNQRNISMAPAEIEPVVELATMKNSDDEPSSELANRQLRQLLEANIDKLPDTFRRVFMLRAIEQCSVRETANILDIPEATVKTRFHRANSLLQQQLQLYMQKTGLSLYEFAGHRCDAVVSGVLDRLFNHR